MNVNLIFINDLLLYQFVVLLFFTDDIKSNMDYFLKEMLKTEIAQYKYIALGMRDFNYYLNETETTVNYNDDSIPIAYVHRVGENKHLEIVRNGIKCYLPAEMPIRQTFNILILHVYFKKEVRFSFQSLIFNNQLGTKKKFFKFFTFCPIHIPLKKILTYYFKKEWIDHIDFFTSHKPFLKVKQQDQENIKFNLLEGMKLFDVDFDLAQVQKYEPFEVEVIP